MSVYGVGKLGVMKDGAIPKATKDGKTTREYDVWKSMLQRCYSNKFHEKYPTYKDCTVCDRWLVFANFLEDLPLIEGYEFWRDNPKQGIALDKDIKVKDNKVYSLDTVKFVSRENNVKERNFRCGQPSEKQKKKIMAVSLTENKVLVFQSLRQAEKLGFDHSAISKCCQGKYKSHKGYKWKYV